ncbi:ankyrin repeat-containing protein at3g12360 [Phtheirospermum japonicum]|uniref:Ankyrin repeat-containing protein at3g12360 n=1 Tax=Phtheirospermum japonicum TaxID=374723 RepID=A0A830AXQ6_9LAMI|nr:ankyrin repeat-containing protein at3g12360 [Phtheirospermum japonicum]
MDKRLSEAAIQGNVTSLAQILDEDPLILDRIIVSCVSDTPLHTAAALGHLGFVKQLLSRKPELAGGEARNADGRTAVHVAAIKGRAAVLAEIARVEPEWIRVVTDRGETGLHLCVKWNRVEAVKVLGNFGDDEMINRKDCEGNSALHIAVTNKNIEIINYLLTLKGLQVNALNKNGLTALDLLRQSPRDLKDMEIENALQKSRASSAKELHLITESQRVPQEVEQTTASQETRPKNKKPVDWLGRKRSALMVVASLIATVAFQAGLTPPGGVWQDDYTVDENGNPVKNPHSVGQSVMAYQEPGAYGIFMIFNTIAFLSSLSIILILVSGLPLNRRRWMWVQMVIMWIAITAQVWTYFVNLKHMSPADVEGMLREVTEISVLTWLTLMSVVFVGNAVRMNLWVLRKYGYIKPKGRNSEAIEDDREE